nr:S41 family peptidase [uncultured Blautia sp.]
MKNKEYIRGIITGVVFSLAVGAGGYAGFRLGDKGVLSDREHVQKLKYLEHLIQEEYLGEADQEALAEGLYIGLVYGLGDDYSRYYTAQEYQQENSSTTGSYVGIGIAMQKNEEGGVKIAECYEGGPGEQAGLKVGDIISAVNGTDIMEMDTSQVAELVRNSQKDQVVLTIHRMGVEKPLKLNVKITDVELPSVFSEMLENKIGYIRISQFMEVTPGQYREAFETLQNQGMEKLVVDLRGNPGGLLTSVCSILGDILPEGLIVYTEDKYGNRQEERSEGKSPLTIPLAVLVNENSASASEIFAGAVKDYGIGTIVGTTTFGKGVVQELHPLSDGSAVKLTVSNYYTPKGKSIHEVGIEPDVEVKLAPELLNKEEITHEEDNQLQEALKILEREM